MSANGVAAMGLHETPSTATLNDQTDPSASSSVDVRAQDVTETSEVDVDGMEEEEHFERIVTVFRQYGSHVHRDIQRDYLCYSRLPETQRALLHPSYPQHLVTLKKCAASNVRLLQAIITGVGAMFENADHQADEQQAASSHASRATAFQMEKLQSSLRQIVRDWSPQGQSERNECYGPVIEAVKTKFPMSDANRHEVRILVPGSGLGRLAWEFAHYGYTCQGNEFSLYMLFISNFVLNRGFKINSLTVYPWLHQKCNNLSFDDQLAPATFPDVDTTDLPKDPHRFSMAAGEFCEVYGRTEEAGTWNVVTTVFFLDTAHNVIDYIQTIYRLLKPGGIWVNFGPLLYHFADMPNEDSIELPYSEIRRIILAIGFKITEERTEVPTSYTQNPRSMLQYHYRSVFLVCEKPEQQQ